jgi:endonuclease G, mitochondrial
MTIDRTDFRLRARVTHALIVTALVFAAPIASSSGRAAVSEEDEKQGIIECTASHLKKHNPDLAGKPDRLVCFQAYVSNFNTQPRTIKGKTRFLGVPHWVAHHIEKAPSPEPKDRPPTWFTVPDLAQQGIAPTDASYAFSKAFRDKHKNWFERGHLAQKYLAERLGGTSGFFTHNVVNAVPQRSQFNKSAWLTLECFTGAWANKFGEVWVITGPIFRKNKPIVWLRSDSNKTALPVAIPVAMFKIVARQEQSGQWNVLGFIYPQTHKSYAKGPFDPGKFLHLVAEIERLTGEEFLAGVPDAATLKKKPGAKLWPVASTDFDSGCKSQKADVP